MANDIPDQLFKRMVLVNQYRILALVHKDDVATWTRAAEIAQQGWPVEDLPGVELLQSYMKDALTRDDQRFVLQCFHLFELIQDGIERGFRPKREHALVDFPGFDGNNETNLLSYARHVVNAEQRFTSVKRWMPDLNSHMPTLELYQTMLAEWNRQGEPLVLSEEQFDRLIEAQVHPSMRKPSTAPV
ncbi:MAG TPA: YfbU family protein [Allosphingosinicella sp.]